MHETVKAAVTPVEAPSDTAQWRPASTALSPRVLIVEDSPTQAILLARALESAGITVCCVETGAAALEQLSEELPDLVITDLRLPGINGDELCRRIRLNPRARDLPILMLTGEAGTELRGLQSGVDAYVSKSDDQDVLLLRVRALLRRDAGNSAVADKPTPRRSAPRLAIVGGTAEWRRQLAAELEGEGWSIRILPPEEADRTAFAGASDDGVLILSNDGSGIELCRRILIESEADLGAPSHESIHSAHGRPAVLVLMVDDDREQTIRALEAGADDVVAASRDVSIVKARLRALLGRKMLRDEQKHAAAEARLRDLQLAQAQADKRAAEAKAALAGQLEAANRELRQTQGQLVQAAKMASLGQLVAGIAHEINNPLAFVINHERTIDRAIEAIGAEVSAILSEEGQRKLQKVRARIRDSQMGLARIQDLVVKLRTFSRLDEGSLKQVDLNDSIESALTLLQYRLGDRIRLVRDFRGPAALWCYADLLNQVIMNVLSNAIDAIDQDGEIAIRTRSVPGFVEIEIADSGKGMPESVRQRIFDPFFTTKPVGSGTGLGMSISYGILQRHRGMLEVQSEEGRGTQVTLRIPDDLETASPVNIVDAR
ncbi:MAG TPA: response regulator [Burkholderiaceae bacterium]|jgi:two-component system NtrC family sensor kinase|nr:response regulator [Burkholderiaceae bacterium]